MKRLIIPIFAMLIIGPAQSAEYQARYKIQDVTGLQPFNPAENWVGISPNYTTWVNDGVITSCSNWSPAESTIAINQSFIQTATDCLQPQKRSRQDREQDTYSKVIKNIGPVVIESQNLIVPLTRSAIGTKENWITISPNYTTWTNNGSIANCTNWSPDPSTVTINESFTQTATDCQQPQVRSRQDREQESTTNEIRNIGNSVVENKNITVSSTRNATGTKENWVAITPTYTTWTNNGSLTNCTNWSPETSTVTYNQSFTQTATDCQQPQTRSKQDREQETTTNTIRNVGNPTAESQNITVSSTRAALGTKESWVAATPSYTAWTGISAAVCTWTPDVSTVRQGTKFTQTGTCTQTQTRTKQAREQEVNTSTYRDVGAPITESQSSSYSAGSRQAYGTKFCDRVCQGGG